MKGFCASTWVLLIFVTLSSLLTAGTLEVDVGGPPASHVWDRDDLFRNDPEVMSEISKVLIDLKKDQQMEIYLILYSTVIGEGASSLASRCHATWLGNENDGLVLVLSLNGGTAGEVGRSNPLYQGAYLEHGVMPRISFVDLETIVYSATVKLKEEENQIDRVKIFTMTVADGLRANLEREKKGGEKLQFMGWMTIALLVCAVLTCLLLKFLGEAETKSKTTFHFPDFTVPQRLRAANGGGKISVIDFGSPSSDER